MPGEDDDTPWEDEFKVSDDAPTKLDEREAVPDPVPPLDSTGKYKTLPGFGNTTDVQSELAFGRGCIHCTKKWMMAFKLWQMAAGVPESVAQSRVDKLRIWADDPRNAELVRVAMED